MVLFCIMTETVEQFQNGGGELMLNVIRSHRCSSTYCLSNGVAMAKSLRGNTGCTRDSARGKTGVALGDKLQNGGDTRVGDIDFLVGSVSPLHWESCMSYEILNEDKTNFIIDVIKERLPL